MCGTSRFFFTALLVVLLAQGNGFAWGKELEGFEDAEANRDAVELVSASKVKVKSAVVAEPRRASKQTDHKYREDWGEEEEEEENFGDTAFAAASAAPHKPAAPPQKKKPVAKVSVKPAVEAGKGDTSWDADEFEGLPEDTANVVGGHVPHSRRKRLNGKGVKKWPQDFYKEIAALIFLGCFAVNYVVGRRQNIAIAEAWVDAFCQKGGIFTGQFAHIGTGNPGGAPVMLMRESANVFRFWASGRRHCEGVVCTLQLKRRQDLLWSLYYLVEPKEDTLTFEAYMNPGDMDLICLCASQKRFAKQKHKDCADLKDLCGEIEPPAELKKFGWPCEVSLLCESKDLAAELLSGDAAAKVFADGGNLQTPWRSLRKLFRWLHISDQYVGAHYTSRRNVLAFSFGVPVAKEMTRMEPLLVFACACVDKVGRLRIRDEDRKKAKGRRQRKVKEAQKEAEAKRVEELSKKKAEKIAAERAKEELLDPKTQQKLEEKRRAKELKKQLRRGVRFARA